MFKNCSNFNLREIKIGREDSVCATVINMDGLSDKASLFDSILKSIMIEAKIDNSSGKRLFYELKNSVLSNVEVQELTSFKEVVSHILTGDMVVYKDKAVISCRK
ncbi:MAG: spore germination protein [Thermoanaerobacteraceae bacterium]|nr:spore germination protein [Thermoanaerobacteraceae bacterium]